ncbi:MAG TPA: alpha/beta hydrolase [Spirochaetia bacterium]|nr:alpha/beta hydrolase [Spirochaetia bacterium]
MLTLPSGRQLGYAEYGVAGGNPVFYFHGNTGSRLDSYLFDEVKLRRHGLRLIAIDRPGFGLSPFLPGRSLMDWPRDVAHAADRLGLGRFAVLGFSGGTPYALVCAKAIADRLTAAVLVSAVTPLDIPGITAGMAPLAYTYLKTAQISSGLAAVMMAFMRLALRNENRVHEIAFSAPDRVLQAEHKQSINRSLRESWRNGVHGVAWDAALVVRDWGFPLDSIRMPVHVWQGEADRNTPLGMANYLCRRIPRCVAHLSPHEGHLSIMKSAFDDIARTLASTGRHSQPPRPTERRARTRR